MRIKSLMDDGSLLRSVVINALIDTGVSVKKIDEDTYEVIDDEGNPEVYDLPLVIGYRMVQLLIQRYKLDLMLLIKPSGKFN